MKNILLIFVGGGVGSILRYWISKLLNNTSLDFPLGTLAVNIGGSLCIGVILGVLIKTSELNTSLTLLLATGFCGGFTTFSTFAYENQHFLKNGDFLSFALYTTTSIVLAIAAVFIGIYLTK